MDLNAYMARSPTAGMAESADVGALLRRHVDDDGPTIPSTAVADSLAAALGEIRTAAAPETYGGGDEPAIGWATPAMDTAPISMVITGPAYEDNPVWYANDAFESLTGYAEADVLGENLRCLQGPETAAEPVDTLREATEIWTAAITELQNYRADGTPFYSRVAIAPISDETGTISNWVGFQEPVETAIDTSSP